MNIDNAKLWTTALRSGKYEQGREALRRDGDRFCCLGVLCDVFHKTTGKGKWIEKYQFPLRFTVDGHGGSSYLPHPVLEWIEMTNDLEKELTCRNDNGESFTEIANFIETL